MAALDEIRIPLPERDGSPPRVLLARREPRGPDAYIIRLAVAAVRRDGSGSSLHIVTDSAILGPRDGDAVIRLLTELEVIRAMALQSAP